jgi:hypothetical protein
LLLQQQTIEAYPMIVNFITKVFNSTIDGPNTKMCWQSNLKLKPNTNQPIIVTNQATECESENMNIYAKLDVNHKFENLDA